MEHVLPLSQVLDIQGITEEYSLQIRFDVTDIETVMKQDENGACTAVSATFSITACCEADKNEETCFLRDAYSTCYDAKAVACAGYDRKKWCARFGKPVPVRR